MLKILNWFGLRRPFHSHNKKWKCSFGCISFDCKRISEKSRGQKKKENYIQARKCGVLVDRCTNKKHLLVTCAVERQLQRQLLVQKQIFASVLQVQGQIQVKAVSRNLRAKEHGKTITPIIQQVRKHDYFHV